ncbi:MAG: YciI family protein [Terriglobia bacterium]
MNRALLLFLLLLGISLVSCNRGNDESESSIPVDDEETGKYNEELATKLGADEYGMKKYVFAFLKAGPNRNQDSLTAANLQRAHLENIRKLADMGKLSLAGPFLDGGEIIGVYIFSVDSLEEAKQLTETDPAIQAGRLVMELHPWYGSAALQQVNDLHKVLRKKKP